MGIPKETIDEQIARILEKAQKNGPKILDASHRIPEHFKVKILKNVHPMLMEKKPQLNGLQNDPPVTEDDIINFLIAYTELPHKTVDFTSAELGNTIYEMLDSSKTNTELKNDMTEIFGVEMVSFISKILNNRQFLLKSSKSPLCMYRRNRRQ